MQPLTPIERSKSIAGESLAERIAFAERIGNHRVDSFQLRQAIIRTARQYLQAKRMPEERINLFAPLLAPPPARHGMPTKGSIKVFALLIEFSDYSHTDEVSIIHEALFGSPTTAKPYESFANYYRRASYNQLDLSGGTTLGWYKTNKKRSEITRDNKGRDSLIKEALQHYNAQGHDFSQYDNDLDGFIDYFMVFWTGPDTGWGTFWWGYQTDFSDPSFKLDGKSLKKYSWQWESNPYEKSLQSLNYPGSYVRHANWLGYISPIDNNSSTLDKTDATWKIVSGLADSQAISFESRNYPGQYLRHQKARLILSPKDDTYLFKADATFWLKEGLADRDALSFMSFNFPDYYIHHRSSELWLDQQASDDLYKKDATFKIVSSWLSGGVRSFRTQVVIHETGHALGLPDLYDYDGTVGPDGGVGGADMMDANQFDHNCFSKWMLGWLSPAIISGGTQTLTLNSSGSSKDCVAIWPDLDSGEIFSELFMVQNRQLMGNDIELAGQGLMIWHVDARLDSAGRDFLSNNSFTPNKLVRLMEADGLEDIEANLKFNLGDFYTQGKTFSPCTTPSSARYDGSSSFVEVSNITASGSKMSAVFKVIKGE